MKKVITTMLVAAMVLSMAVPSTAATIKRKTTSGTSSSTKVSGDYSLKMVDKTLQFVRGGKVVSSIDTKDGKVTLRKSSAGGISVVFTDAKGKRRNITLGKQNDAILSGTFVQLSIDKALGSTYNITLEKGSKASSLYAKGSAKVIVDGSVTTLNVTSSSGNVQVNGSVSKAYAIKKSSISGITSSKITETSTGTSSNGSITSGGSSGSSNTNWGNSSNTGGTGGGVVGGIIGGGTTNPSKVNAQTPRVVASVSPTTPKKGDNVVLSVSANVTDGGTLSYAWYDASGKLISGQTGTSFTIPSVAVGTHKYTCRVTNTNNKVSGNRTSTVAQQFGFIISESGEVLTKPVVTAKATTVSVEVNKPATLEVVVTNEAAITDGTLSYQWYNADGTIIANQIAKTYTVTPTVAGDKDYYCIVKSTSKKDTTNFVTTQSPTIKVTATAVIDTELAAAKAAVRSLNGKVFKNLTEAKAAIVAAVKAVAPNVDVNTDKVVLAGIANAIGPVKLTKGDVSIEETVTLVMKENMSELDKAKAAVEALKGKTFTSLSAAKKAIIDAVKAAAPTVEPNVDGLTGTTAITGNVILSLTGETNVTVPFTGTIVEAPVSINPVVTIDAPANLSEITYDKTKPIKLTAKATVDGKESADIKYEWYRSTASNPTETDKRTLIGSEAVYTISANDVYTGGYYYFVIATHAVGDAADYKTTTSETRRLIVKASENATPIPVISVNIPANDTHTLTKGTPRVLSITADAPSKGTLSYQWYKSTDASNPNDMSKPITGATSNSYTVANNEFGTAYYFCVVTNTLNGDTESVKSNYSTINVQDMVTVSSVTSNGDADKTTTTEIVVTFNKDVIGLNKNNFSVVGVTDAGKTPKITLDSVTDYTNNLKKYTLKVSGIDIKGEANVTVKNLPAKYKLTGEATTKVAIHVAAETAAKAVSMETIPLSSGETESTKVRVILDKAPTADQLKNLGVGKNTVTMGSTTSVAKTGSAGSETVDPAKYALTSNVVVDPSNPKAIIITFKCASGTDTEVWLTQLLGDPITLAADVKIHSTVTRAAAGSTFEATDAIMGSTDKELNITVAKELSSDLPSEPATLFTFKDKDGKLTNLSIKSVTVPADSAGKVIRIILDDSGSTPVLFEHGMKVVYTPKDDDNFTDTLSNPGKLKAFELGIMNPYATASTEAPAISEVVIPANDGKVKKAVVVMNMPIKVESGVTLNNLFKVTDANGTDLAVTSITQTSYSKSRAASNNAFEITFTNDLPDGVQLKVAVKDPDVAKNVKPVAPPPTGQEAPSLPNSSTGTSPVVNDKSTAEINKIINEKITASIKNVESDSGLEQSVYSTATNTLTVTVKEDSKEDKLLSSTGTGLIATLSAFVDGTAEAGYGITGADINGVYQKFEGTKDSTTDELKSWFNTALLDSIATTLSKKGYSGDPMEMTLNDLVNYMGDMKATVHYTKNDTAKTPFTLNYTVSFVLGAPKDSVVPAAPETPATAASKFTIGSSENKK